MQRHFVTASVLMKYEFNHMPVTRFPHDTRSHCACCQGRTVGREGVLPYPDLGSLGVSRGGGLLPLQDTQDCVSLRFHLRKGLLSTSEQNQD